MREEHTKGVVYIVGAGPGDPDLITVKALKLLRIADVVIYDKLLNPEILNFCHSDCELIYAGKSADHHTISQNNINKLMIDFAKDNKTIVRLKGGDPFVFGRGGEEALELKKENIPFEIVPGVTSAISAPAFAGIPVTHRGISSSVTFITGHEDPNKESDNLDYIHLAKDKGTLVFLMSARSIGRISFTLIKNGMAKETTIAIVENATKENQRNFTDTLGNAVKLAEREEISSPAIFVVGEVAKLSEKLDWFKKGRKTDSNSFQSESHKSNPLLENKKLQLSI
ncbi:MAG: uroporphyrinogen-III C-methyltransferase, partial [Nitrospinota bacterium]|nr:uroporphyrinogen-III C-methyltransferase [Nitrospinota bacterium]